jgi:hypothetical protein
MTNTFIRQVPIALLTGRSQALPKDFVFERECDNGHAVAKPPKTHGSKEHI